MASYRTRATLVLLLLSATLFWGCRTPVVVEGNLHPQPFLSEGATITKDQGGRLFAVAPLGVELQPYGTIFFDGQRHLFRVEPRGERAGQLFGLTRFDMDWYNRAMTGGGEIQFHERLEDLTLSGIVGYWEGGAEESVLWLGDSPRGSYQAVVLSVYGGLDSSFFSERILGTAEVSDESITPAMGIYPADRGPYLVLLDGSSGNTAVRAGAQVGGRFRWPQIEGWTVETLAGTAEVENAAEIAQRAGQAGVELLIARRGGNLAIGFAADAQPPGYGPPNLRPLLIGSAILIPEGSSEEARRDLLLAMDALFQAHPLTAAYFLHRSEGWSLGESPRATTLALGDLSAAAGFESWARAAILDGEAGLGAESSLTLARAFAYQGNFRGAIANVQRARERFARWPAGTREFGLARSFELEGILYLAEGNHQGAQRSFGEAGRLYQSGADPYRSALAYRRMGQLDPESVDLEALSLELTAIGATFEGSRTLLLGAAAHLGEGNLAEGAALLESWQARFGGADGPRLRLLAEAVTKYHQWLERGGWTSRLPWIGISVRLETPMHGRRRPFWL